MKITNFKRTGEFCTKPDSPLKSLYMVQTATVDITTGFLWMKKTETKEVFLDAICWRFADTGKYTPNFDVENLARAYDMKKSHEKFLEAREKAGVQ